MIEGQVPQDHVLLTIPGVGRLAAGIIIGIVGDIRRFPKPESFVAHCGLDPVVERSGRAVVSTSWVMLVIIIILGVFLLGL